MNNEKDEELIMIDDIELSSSFRDELEGVIPYRIIERNEADGVEQSELERDMSLDERIDAAVQKAKKCRL